MRGKNPLLLSLFFSQRAWWSADKSEAGLSKMKIRLASDTMGHVSELYGVFKLNDKVAFRLVIKIIIFLSFWNYDAN